MDSASPVATSVDGRTTTTGAAVPFFPAKARFHATLLAELGADANAANGRGNRDAVPDWGSHVSGLPSKPLGRGFGPRTPDRRRYRRPGRPRPTGEGPAQ